MESIDKLVSQLTQEEKAALVTGASNWTTVAIDRLGIPGIFVTDGPHGVRKSPELMGFDSKSLPATCFPTASCLASTWDTALIHRMGQALGDECIALGVDVLLGPGVNMKRSPLCGRNFEYFSEDPYLAGEMAASLINGIQSKGVGTSLKHFAANNQETRRFAINAEVDERSLHEIYLAAFEKAVKQAHPWTVMAAYNRLNGTYCSEHHELLVDILKKDWGYDGLVVSDWGAVRDLVASLRGGLHLEMPGPQPRRTQAVIEAVHNGTLDPARLDDSARQVLALVAKAIKTAKGSGKVAVKAHHSLARQIAGEGMVLLKNDGILPLKGQRSIALIGRAAKEAYFQGGGSSHINPTRVDNPFDELKAIAGDASLTYCEGYPTEDSLRQDLIDEAVTAAGQAEVALIYVALPPEIESEGYDRPNLSLMASQVALIQAVCRAQPRTVVILNSGSAVAMSDWIDGTAAVLEAWMMGQAGGGAIADVLCGKVNPSGKLAETFPMRLEDTPAYLNFPGENGVVRYGEGLYIGYRHYDARKAPVLFPFGYGLSYTSFAFSRPAVSATRFKDVDGVMVSVDVTNTGQVTGKEVVQVYVHDVESRLPRPPKELKGFAKVELAPGETKTVQIPLDSRAFAYYHPGHHRWITEDGEFEIQIGASSADIRFTLKVTLQSSLALPSLLNRDSTIQDWMDDDRGSALLLPLFNEMMGRMMAASGGAVGSDLMGMNMMTMLREMPLLSLGLFIPPELTGGESFDQFVDNLLSQIKM